jgi:hypothetical protein
LSGLEYTWFQELHTVLGTGKLPVPVNKQRYIDRLRNNENWSKSGIDTAGFWSHWLLWNKPTIKDSYMDVNRRFKI